MTTIEILGGDWELLFEDETVGGNAVAGMKMLRRTSGASSTVYTTRQLYSAVAEVTDEFQAMGFSNPMLPVTPNAFTMENNYFIPRRATEYLDEGAISADWTVTSGEGVYRKVYTNTTPFVDGDIGRQVVEASTGDTGTLLDFEVEPDGTLVLWIRPDTSGDTFTAASGVISVTADGGTGSGTAAAAATSGSTLYSSIQVIGSVPTATEVYLVQDRNKMTDYTGGFQWWTTDTTVSLGIIDILIRVINAGVTIASGDVEVFGRRYTSLYDNFRLNVVTGGRSALPLASAPDINNTTGYWTAAYDAGSGTQMSVGDYITNTQAGSTGGRYVITAILAGGSSTSSTGQFQYYTVGDLTEFANNDTFTSTSISGTIMGAPTASTGGPTDTSGGQGGTVTITYGHLTADHDGDNLNEPYSIEVDAQTNVPASKVYERIKYVTKRGATSTDLWGASSTEIDVPGETYRGLSAQVFYDASTGTFTEGDDVTGSSGYTARVVSVNSTGAYVMLTDQQTSLDAVSDNDLLFDEASDSITVFGSPDQFTSPKSSPLGTFTGSQIFGARGVYFSNPDPADTQNYLLTDDNGTLRTPPNTVAFTVLNSTTGDRILVARDTGVSGIIDKDQFSGLSTASGSFNGQGDLAIRVAGSIDSEVPQSGYVRIVHTSLQQEHHYVYDSVTIGATDSFNLRDITEGTAITSASSTALIDTSAQFDSPQVLPGMLVRNTTSGKHTHIWEVVAVNSTTNLTVRQLYGPGSTGGQDWDVGNTYSINTLIGTHTSSTAPDYSTADNVYDLILDLENESTSGVTVSNTFVKTVASNFGVVVNVRNGKNILPFTQNVTVGDSGGSVTVVRTPDTIAV